MLLEILQLIDPTPNPIPAPISVSNSGTLILITAMTGLVTATGSLFVGYLNHKNRMRELDLEAEALRDERADRRRRNYGPPDGYERRRLPEDYPDQD